MSYGGNTLMGDINPANTPYTYYAISKLGNSDISWEMAEKEISVSIMRCSMD